MLDELNPLAVAFQVVTGDQAVAEELRPEAIHGHASGQRVCRPRDPLGEFEAAAAVTERGTLAAGEHVEKAQPIPGEHRGDEDEELVHETSREKRRGERLGVGFGLAVVAEDEDGNRIYDEQGNIKVAERLCQSCYGTGWEILAPETLLKARIAIFDKLVPSLKQIEHTGDAAATHPGWVVQIVNAVAPAGGGERVPPQVNARKEE